MTAFVSTYYWYFLAASVLVGILAIVTWFKALIDMPGFISFDSGQDFSDEEEEKTAVPFPTDEAGQVVVSTRVLLQIIDEAIGPVVRSFALPTALAFLSALSFLFFVIGFIIRITGG